MICEKLIQTIFLSVKRGRRNKQGHGKIIRMKKL